jgi:hypothetical protein
MPPAGSNPILDHRHNAADCSSAGRRRINGPAGSTLRSRLGILADQGGKRLTKSVVVADIPPDNDPSPLSEGVLDDCIRARHGRRIHHDQQPGLGRQAFYQGRQGAPAELLRWIGSPLRLDKQFTAPIPDHEVRYFPGTTLLTNGISTWEHAVNGGSHGPVVGLRRMLGHCPGPLQHIEVFSATFI